MTRITADMQRDGSAVGLFDGVGMGAGIDRMRRLPWHRHRQKNGEAYTGATENLRKTPIT
jgi:hypothetical protein